MKNPDMQNDENLNNNSLNKITDIKSNQKVLKDSHKFEVKNSLYSNIELNTFIHGKLIFNEKEVQECSPSNGENNLNSPTPLTKKAILSCLNNRNTTKNTIKNFNGIFKRNY